MAHAHAEPYVCQAALTRACSGHATLAALDPPCMPCPKPTTRTGSLCTCWNAVLIQHAHTPTSHCCMLMRFSCTGWLGRCMNRREHICVQPCTHSQACGVVSWGGRSHRGKLTGVNQPYRMHHGLFSLHTCWLMRLALSISVTITASKQRQGLLPGMLCAGPGAWGTQLPSCMLPRCPAPAFHPHPVILCHHQRRRTWMPLRCLPRWREGHVGPRGAPPPRPSHSQGLTPGPPGGMQGMQWLRLWRPVGERVE